MIKIIFFMVSIKKMNNFLFYLNARMKKSFKLASIVALWWLLLVWSSLVNAASVSDLGTKKTSSETSYLCDGVIKIVDKYTDKVDNKAKDAFWSLSSAEAKKYIKWIYGITADKFYWAYEVLKNNASDKDDAKTKVLMNTLYDIALLFNVKWAVIDGKYLGDHHYYNIIYKWDDKNNYKPSSSDSDSNNSSSGSSNSNNNDNNNDKNNNDTTSKDTVDLDKSIKDITSEVKKIVDSDTSVDKTLYEMYSKYLRNETIWWKTVVWNFVLEIWAEDWHKAVNNWKTSNDFTKLLNAWSWEVNFIAMFWAKRTIDVVKKDYAELKSDTVTWKTIDWKDWDSTSALRVLNNFDKWFFNKWEWYYWFAPFTSESDAKEFVKNTNLWSKWEVVKIWTSDKYAVFFEPFEL